MTQITLSLTQTGWMATFIGDTQVKALFGSDTLLTGFRSSMPAHEVVARIQAANPGDQVVVADQEVAS